MRVSRRKKGRARRRREGSHTSLRASPPTEKPISWEFPQGVRYVMSAGDVCDAADLCGHDQHPLVWNASAT